MRKSWVQRTVLNWKFWIGAKPNFGPPPNLSVTVVVPAFNEEKSIANTIDALFAQTFKGELKIIVVDDCSTDRTNEIASSYSQVTVLRPEKNSGTKAQALNYALPFVETDLFVCVDGDTILDKHAIEKTIPYFNDEETGMVCGSVIPQFSKTFWELGRTLEYLYAFSVIKGAQENLSCVLIASGCFTVIRTDLLKIFGGYSQRTMAEDMDLTWTIVENGYYVRFVSDALAWVVDPPDAKTYHSQMTRWTHGFLQNIRVRNFNLFKSWRLGIPAYFYWTWAIIGPLTIPLMFLAIFANPLMALLFVLIFYGAVIWIPSFIKAIQVKMPLTTFFKSIIPMFLMQYVSIYIFMESMFNEFVMNKTVKTWVKGH